MRPSDAFAAATFARWRERPDVMVRELFGVEPDAWQAEVLAAFPSSPRMAMRACKGPGKTAVLAWLVWNFLLTRPHPKVAATSISGDNLADNLWTELAKWRNASPVLQAAFEWTKTRIFARQHPETWWCSARTWSRSADSQQQADTLAGLHADYLLFILDESGGIPDSVMVAAEAGLASGIESHIVQAGNPTMLEGPLYRASVTDRADWHVVEITGDPDDPKRSPRVSVDWARKQIRTYGKDDPWVLVNVFGRFPPASINSLIGPDDVQQSMKRHYRVEQYGSDAMILGVDVAREGDDRSVIWPRQGVASWHPKVLRNMDGPVGAGYVAKEWRDRKADACFLDGTGGWATSWHDSLRGLQFTPVSVNFSGKPTDGMYFNKRSEMLFACCKWVKDGGALPDEPELIAELCTPTYSFKGDKMIIEPKEAIKARLGRSPDMADALALTFAYPVHKQRLVIPGYSRQSSWDYDPHMAA